MHRLNKLYLSGCKEDVFVYKYPLPGIKALTRKNEDGTYTVLVDDRLQKMQQLAALRHELGHIIGDDFSGGSVAEIEMEAHHAEKEK